MRSIDDIFRIKKVVKENLMIKQVINRKSHSLPNPGRLPGLQRMQKTD